MNYREILAAYQQALTAYEAARIAFTEAHNNRDKARTKWEIDSRILIQEFQRSEGKEVWGETAYNQSWIAWFYNHEEGQQQRRQDHELTVLVNNARAALDIATARMEFYATQLKSLRA